jgi:NAD(P)-dependent dehydrogenase (short-subunit alcohol dehydrogenase family)
MQIEGASAVVTGGASGLGEATVRRLHARGARVVTPTLALLPEEQRAALAAGIPFPVRLGEPDDYAHLVTFLVENSYLNGETIRLDGALRMPPK